MPTALLVEDEPYPRAQLKEWLAVLWPGLQVVAEAVDGPQALGLFDAHRPDVAFVDIRLPGLDGLQVARHVAGRAHVVFVTAFDEHAVAAFEHGAVDYLLKPLALPRLSRCVERLRERLGQPPADLSALLRRLAEPVRPEWLRYLQAGDGRSLRLVMVEDVLYFQSDTKYTRVVAHDGESLIRTPVRELLQQLDPERFWQIHRGTVVNLAHVREVSRNLLGQMRVYLKGRDETLSVSQSFQPRFRSM